MRSVIVYHDLRRMGPYPDRGYTQVRPSRLLILFSSPCQLLVTAILVKAQLCSSRGGLLLSSVGLRFGSSGRVAGVPRREEAEQQGNNGDDRAEFHELPLSPVNAPNHLPFCQSNLLVTSAASRFRIATGSAACVTGRSGKENNGPGFADGQDF